MNYTIKAIETRYGGVNFRSRLEAKWAAMFDLLGWEWTYEPTDFNGWIPDFAIHGKRLVYVEVKPVVEFPQDVADEIDASGCTDEALIVGLGFPLKGEFIYKEAFGWLRQLAYNWDSDTGFERDSWAWDQAVFGRWKSGGGRIGFCHSIMSFHDRIIGGYDGGSFGALGFDISEATALWREAGNRTRWTPARF